MAQEKRKGADSFEAGLTKLEKLVESLEANDLSLDEAILAFEDGIKLSQKLTKKLTEAEARLLVLTKDQDDLPKTSELIMEKDDIDDDEDDEDDS